MKQRYQDEKDQALFELNSLRSQLIHLLHNVAGVYIAVNSGRHIANPDDLPGLPSLEEVEREMRSAKDSLARYKKVCEEFCEERKELQGG